MSGVSGGAGDEAGDLSAGDVLPLIECLSKFTFYLKSVEERPINFYNEGPDYISDDRARIEAYWDQCTRLNDEFCFTLKKLPILKTTEVSFMTGLREAVFLFKEAFLFYSRQPDNLYFVFMAQTPLPFFIFLLASQLPGVPDDQKTRFVQAFLSPSAFFYATDSRLREQQWQMLLVLFECFVKQDAKVEEEEARRLISFLLTGEPQSVQTTPTGRRLNQEISKFFTLKADSERYGVAPIVYFSEHLGSKDLNLLNKVFLVNEFAFYIHRLQNNLSIDRYNCRLAQRYLQAVGPSSLAESAFASFTITKPEILEDIVRAMAEEKAESPAAAMPSGASVLESGSNGRRLLEESIKEKKSELMDLMRQSRQIEAEFSRDLVSLGGVVIRH